MPQYEAQIHRTILLCMRSWLGAARTLMTGLAEYARRHGPWDFQYEVADWRLDEMLRRYRRVDGVVTQWPRPEEVRALRRRKIPAVLLGGDKPVADLPLVTVSNFESGRLAGLHLIEKGFRNLAISSPCEHYPGNQTLEGLEEVADRRGLELAVLDPEVHRSLHDRKRRTSALKKLQRWLESLPKPVGIVMTVLNEGRDLVTICHTNRWAIPEDVAVLAIGEDPLTSSLFCPTLTTVDNGAHQAGFLAGQVLDGLMAGQAPQQQVTQVEPLGANMRGSTDVLAIDDPFVVQAIRFIRANLDEPIKVADVLRSVHVSRRTLEYAFKKHLGRTLHEEITRQRIERVKELLATTNMATPDIAAASGFNYSSQMFHVFKRKTGITPNQYRGRFVR